MATTQHYLWAAGHFILLLSSLRYLGAWVMFRTPSPWWYKACYTGALISYAIVCQKSLGAPVPNATYIKKAILDENVQYFLLALFWWYSGPVAVTLVPFAIFSLFHALTFTRTTLMPQFLPPGPPTTAGGSPTPPPISKKLQVWVKSNYDTAMKVVAYSELFIMLRVTVGVLLRQNSLLAPVIYAFFLRQRYFQTAFTRNAIADVHGRIKAYVTKPGAPPMLAQVYDRFTLIVSHFVGSIGGTAAPNAGAQ